jgi:hypothetical protein
MSGRATDQVARRRLGASEEMTHASTRVADLVHGEAGSDQHHR